MRLEDLQTPTLLIDLDAVAHNLATMHHYLGGNWNRWRPHVKTSKVPAVLEMLLDAGVRRFKVATSREAEILLDTAGSRSTDLLFAMSMQGANLERATRVAQAHPDHRCSMISETAEHAAQLKQLGFGIFVDLDPGYHRTGIPMDNRDRIDSVVEAAGDALVGLHCYDGHLYQTNFADRAAAARSVYAELVALARTLPTAELCTSGTPTFPIALAYEPLQAFEHTVSPGTVVYWDTRSEELGIDGFACAVQVQARVIANPHPDRITMDAGSKALDAAAGDPCASALGPYALRALTPSEEHLPMLVLQGSPPAQGTLLRLVPRHVCPTVNLADEAVLIENGAPREIVAVAARGHEVLPEG